MKQIILFASIFLMHNTGFTQNIKIDSLTNDFKYDTVYNCSSNKDVIYTRLKSWTDSYFVSSKAAIQNDDKDLGQIFIKSSFHQKYIYDGSQNDCVVSYKCRIYIKDHKTRVIVTSFAIDSFNNLVVLLKARPNSFLSPALKASDSEFKELLTSINKTINSKSESEF